MNMVRPISSKEWRSRWDAESLAKAEEIKADKVRYGAAQTAAIKMVEEKQRELKDINRIANKAKPAKTTQKANAIPAKAPNNKPRTIKRDKRVASGVKNSFNVFKKI